MHRDPLPTWRCCHALRNWLPKEPPVCSAISASTSLSSLFTDLNVLIGIVLNAMDEAHTAAEDDDAKPASALTLLESAHTSGALSEDATARLQILLR